MPNTRLRAVVEVSPQANPELLPMGDREAVLRRRLQVLRSLQHAYSVGVRVRPAEPERLALAAGASARWVREAFAPGLVERQPFLVVPGRIEAQLRSRTVALLGRLNTNGLLARRLGPKRVGALLGDMWGRDFLLGLDRACVRIGGRARLYRSWVIRELPRIIHLGWLAPLTGEEIAADVVLHVRVRKPGPTARTLQRRVRQWRAVAQGDTDYGVALHDAERCLAAMRRNVDGVVEAGLYVTAPLEQAPLVENALDGVLVDYHAADYAHDLARRSTLPIGADDLRERMPLDLTSVAATDVFATAG